MAAKIDPEDVIMARVIALHASATSLSCGTDHSRQLSKFVSRRPVSADRVLERAKKFETWLLEPFNDE